MIGWTQAIAIFVVIVGISALDYLAWRFTNIERRVTALEERPGVKP